MKLLLWLPHGKYYGWLVRPDSSRRGRYKQTLYTKGFGVCVTPHVHVWMKHNTKAVQAGIPQHLFARFKQTWQRGHEWPKAGKQAVAHPIGLVQEVSQEDVTVSRLSHSEETISFAFVVFSWQQSCEVCTLPSIPLLKGCDGSGGTLGDCKKRNIF